MPSDEPRASAWHDADVIARHARARRLSPPSTRARARTLALAQALALSGAVACGPSPAARQPAPLPSVTASASAKAAPPALPALPPFEPVLEARDAATLMALCERHLEAARRHLAGVRAQVDAPEGKLTFAGTVGAIDDALFEVDQAQSYPTLLALVHPDLAVREAGQKCEPAASALVTGLWLDADVAKVVRAYARASAAAGEKLSPDKQKLVGEVLRELKRNGLELGAPERERLRELSALLTQAGQDFMANLGADKSALVVDKKALDGLDAEYVARHAPDAAGKVRITTDPPDVYPFFTYAKDRKAARELYVLHTNRGGEKNLRVAERLLKLRQEKAALLGYESWAHYAIEPRMAKHPDTVQTFLDKVRVAVEAPAKRELALLLEEHVKQGGKKTDVLSPADRYYYEDRVKRAKHAHDSKALRAYLTVEGVRDGLFTLVGKLYGLRMKRLERALWHPDAEAFEVQDADGKRLGVLYLDLYTRADKYKHAAMFPIKGGKRLSDGSYQAPEAALVCNFATKSSGPAQLSHEDTVTFFHELGHALHHVLTTAELASFAGINAARDFVEAPSQMLEEWAFRRDVLDLFAKHQSTGATIPDELLASLQRSRSFGRALATQRQLFFATLDLELHRRKAVPDTLKLLEEVQNRVDSFKYVKGTHALSSFGHLIGYDAAYYGYQWSLAVARDALTRFEREGMMSPAVAASWRAEVLAKGGSEPEQALVERFLGRSFSYDAYFRFLGGE